MKRLLLLVLVLLPVSAEAAQRVRVRAGSDPCCYASVAGSSGGNGRSSAPWDLATALAQPAALTAGSTLWLRGGTYTGLFTSTLTGTAPSPIIVREYPGERAILDGANVDGTVLMVGGAYTHYRDFEVMSSSAANRYVTVSLDRPVGIQTVQSVGSAVGTKFINLTIYNTSQAFGIWTDAIGAEVYGCVVFNNGWYQDDGGHGHAIYSQNATGTKILKDNILVNQYGYGLHMYTESGLIDNYTIEGNISFNNGGPAPQGYNGNIHVGGADIAQNIALTNNYTYYKAASFSGVNDLGLDAGIENLSATGNRFIHEHDTALRLTNVIAPLVFNSNVFYGGLEGFTAASLPDNTYYTPPTAPTVNEVFVRPNTYETGRANIVIYNWENLTSVSVDISGIGLLNGQGYQYRHVLDYLSAPVTGIYNGSPISIPMTGWAEALAATAPEKTMPQFGAFVIQKL